MSEHRETTAIQAIRGTATLYVVATPIGNLSDLTQRALDVLRSVDAVAAEDTRHTKRLLDHYGIATRTLAVHEHNESAAAQGLVDLLAKGQNIALVTDAGTPGISDPGARVVGRVRDAGYPVVPVPGPCALVAALSAAGIEAGRFFFQGFLPPMSAARQSALEALRHIDGALVCYEAPHRVMECVKDLLAVLGGERKIVIARELTKRYEQIVRLSLHEAPGWLEEDADRCRGEFVLIIEALRQQQDLSAEAERVLTVLLEVLPLKQAVKLSVEITGASRNQLYARALSLKNGAVPNS